MPVPRNVVDQDRLSLTEEGVSDGKALSVPSTPNGFLRVQDQAFVDWLTSCEFDGQPLQTVMATHMRAFAQMRDLQDQAEKKPTKYPIVSVSRGTLSPDMTRWQASDLRRLSIGRRVFGDNGCDKRRVLPWPTPYNIDYLVEVRTGSPQDKAIILQAILGSWRNPIETFLKVDYGPFLGIQDVPLHLGSVDNTDELEPGEEEREYAEQISLTLKGWMPRLGRDVKTVKVQHLLIIQSGPDNDFFCNPDNITLDPDDPTQITVAPSPNGGLLEIATSGPAECPPNGG